MELHTQDLLILAVVLTIVIIVIVMAFRRKYTTDDERRANSGKLACWLVLAIVAVLVVGWLWKSSMHGDGEEYGVFSEAKRNAKNWWAGNKAYRAAKKAGLSDAEAKLARTEEKEGRRSDKKEGQAAEAAAAKRRRESKAATKKAAAGAQE